jgi:hypothetical protein
MADVCEEAFGLPNPHSPDATSSRAALCGPFSLVRAAPKAPWLLAFHRSYRRARIKHLFTVSARPNPAPFLAFARRYRSVRIG